MFRKRRGQDDGADDDADAGPTTDDDDDVDEARTTTTSRRRRSAAAGARPDGPCDVSEVDDPAERRRVDLGGVWLPGRPTGSRCGSRPTRPPARWWR